MAKKNQKQTVDNIEPEDNPGSDETDVETQAPTEPQEVKAKPPKSDLYIFSTLSADVAYTSWIADQNGAANRKHSSVLIAGKANVANPKTFLTPKGMCTPITREQYNGIEKQEGTVWHRHVKAGYIAVSESYDKPDKVSEDMTPKDPGAPLTPEDFQDDKKPTVGAGKSK